MPVLVHLADEREAAKIRKNGIKIGKLRKGIFCMPVLQNFYVSHQWLRELKRRGAKTFVGVYFKMESKSMVYAGKYNSVHKHVSLGEAIKEIMSLADPLGYELVIDRKIEAKEIQKIKNLPQKLGWRYFPTSHTRGPSCACPVCIPLGSIKGKKLRERIEPPEIRLGYKEVVGKLRIEEDESEIEYLLSIIKNGTRRSDPTELVFLLDKRSDDINQSFASALGSFKHKNTRGLLMNLLDEIDELTKTLATFSLLKLYGHEIEKVLVKRNDEVINEAIKEWKE
jgi:hypothetical protein